MARYEDNNNNSSNRSNSNSGNRTTPESESESVRVKMQDLGGLGRGVVRLGLEQEREIQQDRMEGLSFPGHLCVGTISDLKEFKFHPTPQPVAEPSLKNETHMDLTASK